MSRKPRTTSGKKNSNLSQLGLLDMSDFDEGDDDIGGLSDDDIDLEAELAALTGDGGKKQRTKKVAATAPNLDSLIAESLKDIPSDDEIDSGDEDDPELLSELKELALEDEGAPQPPPRTTRPAPPPPSALSADGNSTVSLLQDRIANYTQAEKAAKDKGESSRARRFNRGLKTLSDLLRQAKAGKSINPDDIPPAVSIGSAPDAPTTPVVSPTPELIVLDHTAPEPDEPPSLPEPIEPPPPPPPPTIDEQQNLDPEKQQGLQIILKRKEEFKAAALSAKHAGDKPLALELLKVVKQFDIVVDAYKSNHEMDLNELPTPENIIAMVKSQQKSEDNTQSSAQEPAPEVDSGASGLIVASTMEEALKQRLSAFQEQEAKAKQEGNSAKARRLGRVVKQYEEAIRSHTAGKPIPGDELPTPLGYGPLPTENTQASPKAPTPSGGIPHPTPRPSPRPTSTRHDKQLAFLLQRQKLFKEAAIRAKKEGNIEQAKEYLRSAKGFDSLIEAARGGLVIDLKSLPLPPKSKDQLEHTFDIVQAEDCTPIEPSSTPGPISADDDNVISRLHQQLTNQLKLCLSNRDHYKAMGNVAETNRFEHLAVSVKQDLDVVTVAKGLGNSPPKFHYESRQFSIVQCNTDLNENDLELTIVRGIAYNVPNPKDVDTYVKFDFPYPQDAPVSDRTALVKDTNSPVYNAVFTLPINRSARPCQRFFKRHAIKLEVYSRGGWFSRDALLGAVSVKLEPLQNTVTLHDSFPLMDGRRAAGGSLEVKLRLRTPILQQQIVNTTHKWLVIDN